MKEQEKLEICHGCNLYQLTCNGKTLFNLKKKKNGKYMKVCSNRIREPQNTVSPIQVEAFISLHRTKIKMGSLPLTAFVEAIVQTSDDVFENIDKSLLEKYLGLIQ